MAEVDLKEVEQKLGRNETLTAEEIKAVMSAPPDGANQVTDVEDDLPEEEYEDLSKKEEAPAPKVETKAPVVEPKKEEQKPKVKEIPTVKPSTEKSEDYIKRFNNEVAKPEGSEDFTGWTEAEIGYFRQMRAERSRAKRAEDERDILRLNELKRKQAEEAKPKEEVKEVDPFEGRDPEDPLTVKDLKILMAKKPEAKKEEPAKPLFDPNSPIVASAIRYQDEVARKEIGMLASSARLVSALI